MVPLCSSSPYGRNALDAYPSLAFDAAGKAPVQLFEVTSDGTSSRLEVTNELVEAYIEKEYGVSRVPTNL